MENRFTERFAWNGARVIARTTEHARAFDESYRFAELCGLNGRLLAGRPAPNHYHIDLLHAYSSDSFKLKAMDMVEVG